MNFQINYRLSECIHHRGTYLLYAVVQASKQNPDDVLSPVGYLLDKRNDLGKSAAGVALARDLSKWRIPGRHFDTGGLLISVIYDLISRNVPCVLSLSFCTSCSLN